MIIGNERYIARLIAGYMNDELSTRERRDLELWRQNSAANEQMFQRLSSSEYLGSAMARYGGTELRNDAAWQAVADRTTRKKQRRMHRAIRIGAAAACLAAAITFAVRFTAPHQPESDAAAVARLNERPMLILPDGTSMLLDDESKGLPIITNTLAERYADTLAANSSEDAAAKCFHTLKVPRGCTYPLILADNTVVYLNADSELTFPVEFAPNQRRVFLRKGEAYFKVTRNEKAPFVVEAGPVSVEVLGTAFGIRAHEGEQNIRTVIESGRVRMDANGCSVTLEANEQGSFEYGSGRIEVAPANSQYLLAWVRNRLAFDNVPLRSIMAELARYYSFSPVFLDSLAGDIPFSMNMQKEEGPDGVLRMIERTGKVSFERRDSEVLVRVRE